MIFGFVSNSLQFIVNSVLQIISESGYAGILFLMILESALTPVPSEVVMPFAGYLILEGRFDLWLVILAGTVGNLIGATIAYFFGLHLGRKFILKYGKYILIKKKILLLTEKWFKKYGDKTIFFCRVLPAVRTIISLPAGIGKMNFSKFVVYTFIGSIPWNFGLTYAGMWFGENWHIIGRYFERLDIVIIVCLITLVVWYLLKAKYKK